MSIHGIFIFFDYLKNFCCVILICDLMLAFSAHFKFFICISYPFLSCMLAANLSTFSIFILSGKNGK